MTAPADQRQELARLIGAFRNNLDRLAERGCRWVPAAPSPRLAPPPAASSQPDPAQTGVTAHLDGSDPSAVTPNQPVNSSPPPAPNQPVISSPAAASNQPVISSPAVTPAPEQGDEQTGPPAEVQLEELRAELGSCQRCALAKTRQNLVFGVGSPRSDLMFIGEAPGGEEDQQGIPFVGAAGQLLTKMIEAMGLTREEVYIANIIKCRPPENRDPAPEEMDTCEPYLRQQIQIIAPRLIIAMGNFAAKRLLRTETGITKLRGRFHTYQGVPLMPTFHPAYLLRNPSAKRPVWEDLKAVMAEMDRMKLRRQR